MEIADTFEFLLGTWELSRSIEDHCTVTLGSFRGTATVVEASSDHIHCGKGRARYDEAGELCFGEHTGRASRHLDLMAEPGDAIVMTYFADGRPFVDLDLRSGTWTTLHHCGADRYELTTIVRSPNVVEEHWRVRGPATSYDAVTTLTRVHRPDGGSPSVTTPGRAAQTSRRRP